MNTARMLSATSLVLVALAGCNMPFGHNVALDQARHDYLAARGNALILQLSRTELQQAADALDQADEAWHTSADTAEVDHLAYRARQWVAMARELASQRAQVQHSALASALIEDAQAGQRVLAARLQALNARQTERGMVITIGDDLFDLDESSLQAGGKQRIQDLAVLLDQFPRRRALIEGFTDNAGTRSENQMRSGSRADAVKAALVLAGLDRSRVNAQALGDTLPLASNGSAQGRSLNRRVEIILSDGSGFISSR